MANCDYNGPRTIKTHVVYSDLTDQEKYLFHLLEIDKQKDCVVYPKLTDKQKQHLEALEEFKKVAFLKQDDAKKNSSNLGTRAVTHNKKGVEEIDDQCRCIIS